MSLGCRVYLLSHQYLEEATPEKIEGINNLQVREMEGFRTISTSLHTRATTHKLAMISREELKVSTSSSEHNVYNT